MWLVRRAVLKESKLAYYGTGVPGTNPRPLVPGRNARAPESQGSVCPPKKQIVLVLARNIQDGDGDVCVCAVLWIVHLSLAYARTILQDTNTSTDYPSSHKHTHTHKFVCVSENKNTELTSTQLVPQ